MNNELLGLLGASLSCLIVIAICFVAVLCLVYYHYKTKQIDNENEEETKEKARLKREIKEAVFQEITRYYGDFIYEKEEKTKSKKKDNN